MSCSNIETVMFQKRQRTQNKLNLFDSAKRKLTVVNLSNIMKVEKISSAKKLILCNYINHKEGCSFEPLAITELARSNWPSLISIKICQGDIFDELNDERCV